MKTKELSTDDLDYILECCDNNENIWLNINKKPYRINNKIEQESNRQAGKALKNMMKVDSNFRAYVKISEKKKVTIIISIGVVNVFIK